MTRNARIVWWFVRLALYVAVFAAFGVTVWTLGLVVVLTIATGVIELGFDSLHRAPAPERSDS